jgi:hypothetical protein
MQGTMVYSYERLLMFAAVVLSLSLLDTIIPGLRYIKYVIPLLFLFFIFLNVNSVSVKNFHPVFYAFAIYAIWGLIISIAYTGSVVSLGVNDFIFIFSYILPLGFFFTSKISIESVFKVFSLCFLISCFGIPYQSFSIEQSAAPFESGASFVFGAFSLYFLFGKKIIYLLAALFLMFLSLKRIAFIAFFLCALVYYLPAMLRQFVLSKFSFLILNTFCVTLILGIGFGLFDDFILETTGLNVHHVTMGRFSHYLGIVEELEYNPWSIILGNGIGSAYSFASIHVEGEHTVVNLHSDTLKILFESGIFVFIAFFVLLGKSKNENSKIIMFLYISELCFLY